VPRFFSMESDARGFGTRHPVLNISYKGQIEAVAICLSSARNMPVADLVQQIETATRRQVNDQLEALLIQLAGYHADTLEQALGTLVDHQHDWDVDEMQRPADYFEAKEGQPELLDFIGTEGNPIIVGDALIIPVQRGFQESLAYHAQF